MATLFFLKSSLVISILLVSYLSCAVAVPGKLSGVPPPKKNILTLHGYFSQTSKSSKHHKARLAHQAHVFSKTHKISRKQKFGYSKVLDVCPEHPMEHCDFHFTNHFNEVPTYDIHVNPDSPVTRHIISAKDNIRVRVDQTGEGHLFCQGLYQDSNVIGNQFYATGPMASIHVRAFNNVSSLLNCSVSLSRLIDH
jgi:hypothetical protein